MKRLHLWDSQSKKSPTSILCWNKAKGAAHFWDRASLFRVDWPRTHGSPLPQLPKYWDCRHEPPYMAAKDIVMWCSVSQDTLWHVTLTTQGLDNMPSPVPEAYGSSAFNSLCRWGYVLQISRRLPDRLRHRRQVCRNSLLSIICLAWLFSSNCGNVKRQSDPFLTYSSYLNFQTFLFFSFVKNSLTSISYGFSVVQFTHLVCLYSSW